MVKIKMENWLKYVVHITMNKLIVQTDWAYKKSLKLLIPLQIRLVSSSVNTINNSPITVVRVNYYSCVIRGRNSPSWNGDHQICRPTYIILKRAWNFLKNRADVHGNRSNCYYCIFIRKRKRKLKEFYFTQ